MEQNQLSWIANFEERLKDDQCWTENSHYERVH
jgi:hypothetical protein